MRATGDSLFTGDVPSSFKGFLFVYKILPCFVGGMVCHLSASLKCQDVAIVIRGNEPCQII